MMYRKSKPRMQVSMTDLLNHRRVLAIVCIILFAATVFLTTVVLRGNYSQNSIRDQLTQRMYGASVAAVDELNKIGSIVSSNSPGQLGRVRAYVYYMEQLNTLSISLYGERGRMAPSDAFTTLYSDLDTFEKLLQQAASIIDTRTLMLNHLRALQSYLTP